MGTMTRSDQGEIIDAGRYLRVIERSALGVGSYWEIRVGFRRIGAIRRRAGEGTFEFSAGFDSPVHPRFEAHSLGDVVDELFRRHAAQRDTRD